MALTVLSRIGQNSKVVLTHDVAQRGQPAGGPVRRRGRGDRGTHEQRPLRHVTLTRSERSAIAALVIGDAGLTQRTDGFG